MGLELVGLHPPGDEEGAVLARDIGLLVALFFLEGAGDGLENVAGGDDPLEVAVLVEDQRHVHQRAADGLEHVERARAVHDHRRLLHQRAHVQRHLGEHVLHQVLAHDHADDRIHRSVLYRQHGVAGRPQLLDHFLARLAQVDQFDVEARRHQATGRSVGQPHDARDHVAFLGLEHAGALGLGDDGLDLLVGDPLLGLPALSEQAQHQPAGDVEQPDERGGDRGDERHQRGDAGGNALGIAQRDLLGHQLADDQRQVGNDDHDDADAQRQRDGRIDARAGKRRAQPFAQGGAREGARQHADKGDADLHGGEELAGVLLQLEGHGGAAAPLGREHLEARRPGGHDGEFAHCKQAVDEGQDGDDQDFEKQFSIRVAAPHSASGRLGGGEYSGDGPPRNAP